MCVVEAGTNRSRGNSEELGDLGRLVANVVAEDQDRPFVWCEPPEASIELVPIGDRKELVLGDRRIDGEHVQVVDPLAFPADVGHADIGEEAVDPGVEPVRIAEARQVTPGDHQRVLQGILGPVDITEDPTGNREQAIDATAEKVDKCDLVAALRCDHELSIHRRHSLDVQWGRRPLLQADGGRSALQLPGRACGGPRLPHRPARQGVMTSESTIA
jgi:hypothetical protein